MRRFLACAAVGLALAGALGACATLLGDDFSITDNSGTTTTTTGGGTAGMGGGGAGGGTGGTAGGGGTPLPPVLACDWELPQHHEIARHQNLPNDSWSDMYGVRRGPNSMRLFVQKYSSTQGIEVWTVNSNLTATPSFFAADNLIGAKRLDFSSVAALYSDPGPNGPQLKLRIVYDSNDTGPGYEEVLNSSLALINANSGLYNAQFVPVPDGGSTTVDFAVAYQTTMMEWVEAFGRYDGNPVQPVIVTPPGSMLESDQTSPRAMIHYEGRSYGFFGTDTLDGVREWIWNGTAPEGPPRTLAPGYIVLAVEPGDVADTTNFLAFTFGQSIPLDLYTGQIPNADLGTFDPEADFVQAATFPTQSDLPVNEGFFGWIGDVFVFLGYSPTDENTMRYYFVGVQGFERGQADLPFTVTLPQGETRVRIQHVAAAPSNLDFAQSGGVLQVVWNEDHDIPGIGEFDVLYYDRLRCDPR
jgi:hypothetical protein